VTNTMKSMATPLLLLSMTAALCAAAETGSFDKSLTVSGPVDLDVVTDSGGITVRQGASGSVTVHAVLKADNGWFSSFGGGDVASRIHELEQHPPVEQSGNKVRVGYVADKNLLRGISMRLEIETPRETQLHARADSGGIRVDGLRGPVDCKTDSGGIEIHDVSAAVHAAADSGGIHVRNVQGSLFARVDSGGIEATGIAGSIDAQTDSGSVTLAQTTAATIRAKADSGGVRVTLARGAGYDLSADTESGHISIPELSTQNSRSAHHVEGKVGGGGPLVRIQVESGSVSVD
jgi:putative adhesin